MKLGVFVIAVAMTQALGPEEDARTTQDGFVALTATCTHEGCTITGYQSQTYTCPCHGSQYNTSGQVLKGPAPRALTQFASQFANGILTIML